MWESDINQNVCSSRCARRLPRRSTQRGHANKVFKITRNQHPRKQNNTDILLQGLDTRIYSGAPLPDHPLRRPCGQWTPSDASNPQDRCRIERQQSITMATRQFFVDEAGDLTIFNKRGHSMLGQHGVSKCFMVGVAEIQNPAAVAMRLGALRAELLGDPYFAGASSLQPERRKTAVMLRS